MIVKEGENLSENVGLVTVAYIVDRGVIRVVDSRSGALIREDETEPLTTRQFKEVADKYRELCRR